MPSDSQSKKAKTGPERVRRLETELQGFGLRARLEVLDRLKPGLVADASSGVRTSLRSISEYKRCRKAKPGDRPIAEWVASFGPSDVFFDIGANTGAFSLLAGKLHGERVRVFALEPAFDTFEALVRNILLNELSHVVTPLQVALFDETGLRPFYYHNMGAGSALHAVGEPVDFAGRTFHPAAVQHVLAFRLDDLIARFGLPAPTRIKLDVDGVESRVLEGASRTLSAGPCELWVELTGADSGGAAPHRIVDQLAQLGFSPVTRLPEDPRDGSDVLFVRR